MDPTFIYFTVKDRVDFGIDSFAQSREFERNDPLKGNSLVSTPFMDSTLYLFSAGSALQHLGKKKIILMRSITDIF